MNSKARKAAHEHDDEIQQPPVLSPLHVQDRETSKVAGAPRAWRKMTQLEAAYMQERLGARDSKAARERLDAGVLYTSLWDLSQKAGRDSTANFDLGRSMGSAGVLTERQSAACARLVAVEMHLGERDRTILRAVCAYGHTPAEAMERARLGKDTRVSARLCEALDALADALDRTEKRGRR